MRKSKFEVLTPLLRNCLRNLFCCFCDTGEVEMKWIVAVKLRDG